MRNNNRVSSLFWLCVVSLVLVISCQDGVLVKKTTQILDCSLVFVVDNYPKSYKLQPTDNAIPRSLVFVYKIKNNSSSPAYLPVHSDNVKGRKKPSEISIYIEKLK